MSLPHEGGQHRVVVEHDVGTTMRDGVVLRADVYRPDAPGRFPVLVVRTPYDKSVLHKPDGTPAAHLAECHFFPQRGYVVVVQDCRGRHASEGEFVPFVDEGADGYDTVEWAAAQPWSTGDVGMAGQSYQAITQYLAALEQPPSLRAIAPVSGPTALFQNCIRRHGVFELGWILPYYIGFGRDRLERLGTAATRQPEVDAYLEDPAVRFSPLRREEYLHLPVLDWADRLADVAPYLRETLEERVDGPYWEAVDAVRRAERIQVPALHVASWYDSFLPDPLAIFQRLRPGGQDVPGREQRLLVGPWGHIAFSTPTSGGTGDADFGPESVIELQETLLRWFDHHLRGLDTGLLDEPPVRLFVMGDDRWRDEPGWPLERAVTRELYLHSGGAANSSAGDGTLSFDRPGAEPPDAFDYDPDDPVPTRGGTTLMNLAMTGGVLDQSEVEQRADVLVYTGEELTEPLEVTGPVSVVLHAVSTAPDTDFTAKLVDLQPDGYARNVVEGIVRASFRASLSDPTPIAPGEVVTYEIDLWATSHVFAPGHRLRLEVSSSNFPRYERNPNTGEPAGTATSVVVAHQRVLHETAFASHVRLPVVERS